MAFLHRSTSVTLPDGSVANNERLEYLGDAVLDLVVADYLCGTFPKEREGFLTQMRSKLVNRNHLDMVASKMQLKRVLSTDVKQSRGKKRLCGNALEALVGAMYLDRGYKTTRSYVISHVIEQYMNIDKLSHTEVDFKSRLMEWGQKHKLPVRFVSESEMNAKVFSVQVFVGDLSLASGKGSSKKEAEQQAAKKAFDNIASSPDFAPEALEQYMECMKERVG